jgi:hypothetical protein
MSQQGSDARYRTSRALQKTQRFKLSDVRREEVSNGEPVELVSRVRTRERTLLVQKKSSTVNSGEQQIKRQVRDGVMG